MNRHAILLMATLGAGLMILASVVSHPAVIAGALGLAVLLLVAITRPRRAAPDRKEIANLAGTSPSPELDEKGRDG